MIGYRQIAGRGLECLHEKPIEFEGFIATNWHQLLHELVKVVLRGAWEVIRPWDPFEAAATNEERGFPAPPENYARQTLTKWPRRSRGTGQLTTEKMQYLEVALEQEYAALCGYDSRSFTAQPLEAKGDEGDKKGQRRFGKRPTRKHPFGHSLHRRTTASGDTKSSSRKRENAPA